MSPTVVLDDVAEEDLCETVEDFVHEYDRVVIERTSRNRFRVTGS